MKKKKRGKKTTKHSKKKLLKKTKKRTIKSSKSSGVSSKAVEIKMQPILTQNFVALQKVMLTLSEKIQTLTSQTSRLLELFETSAKALAKESYRPLPTKIPMKPTLISSAPPASNIPMIPLAKPMQSQGYTKSPSKPKPSK